MSDSREEKHVLSIGSRSVIGSRQSSEAVLARAWPTACRGIFPRLTGWSVWLLLLGLLAAPLAAMEDIWEVLPDKTAAGLPG